MGIGASAGETNELSLNPEHVTQLSPLRAGSARPVGL